MVRNRNLRVRPIESVERCVQMGMGVAIVPRMCGPLGGGTQTPRRSPHPPDENAALFVLGVTPRRSPLARRGGLDEAAQRLTSVFVILSEAKNLSGALRQNREILRTETRSSEWQPGSCFDLKWTA